jgi:hypothetical protein
MRITSFFAPLLAVSADSRVTVPGAVYRLRHWPDLPPQLHTADVLGALSVMSSRAVSRSWILRHSKLGPDALDNLLALLSARGDLEVIDTSKYPPDR